MIIKEPEFKTCEHCNSRQLVSEVVYGCDVCRKPLDMSALDVTLLSATVHHRGDGAEDMHFCSWRCALKGLSKAETDYFISLPFLHFDDVGREMSAAAFFEAVREFGREQEKSNV